MNVHNKLGKGFREIIYQRAFLIELNKTTLKVEKEIFFSTGKENFPSIEWLIWPAYLFTVRVINFPLLLLSFIGLIKRWSGSYFTIENCFDRR